MNAWTAVRRAHRLQGVARAAWALRRARDGRARAAAERHLVERMGAARGLPQKLGQILSLRDLDSGTSTFMTLTESPEAAPAREAFAWIAAELGRPLTEVFSEVVPQGTAASLGQVHRARLRDGRPVAVKIQYPGIGTSIDVDLLALGWLAAPLTSRRDGFDLSGYRAELRGMLDGEIDYRAEANRLRRFHVRAADIPGISVPEPIDGLTTPRLLVMSWEDGEHMRESRTWPLADRERLATLMLRWVCRSLFVWRELHADMHPGNLRCRLRPDAHTRDRVGFTLLDFGATKTLTSIEAQALRWLLTNGAQAGADAHLAAYTALGFNRDLLAPLVSRLPAVTRALALPFTTTGGFHVRDWRLSERIAEALGDDRWNFRFAGPPALMFVLRGFHALIEYLDALDVSANWREALDDASIGGTDERPFVPAAVTTGTGERTSMTSAHLKISVTRDGTQVVALTFPAAAAANLEYLVPDDLKPRLESMAIDVGRLAASVVAAGFPSGNLFDVEAAGRSVRVWLE